MQRTVQPKHLLFLIFFALILNIQPYLLSSHNVTANSLSPSFVRQEIVAAPNDWSLWEEPSDTTSLPLHNGYSIQVPNAKNILQCKMGDKFVSPSIESVSYISDGKTLNATVWLTSNFQEPPLKDTIDTNPPTQVEIKLSNLTKAESHMTIDKYATLKIAHELLDLSKNITIDKQPNPTTIGGNSAYEIIYNAQNSEGINLKNMTIWTIKNSKVYDITYSVLQSNFSYYLPIINSMINSFQFDNSSSSNSSKSSMHQVNGGNGNITQFEGLGIKLNYPTYWKKQEEKAVDNKVSTGIIIRSPFRDEGLENPSWHEITFTMAIAIASIQHAAVTDYRVIFSRNPIDNNSGWGWVRKLTEVSAYGKERVLGEEKDYRVFYQPDSPYILFSLDLDKINFPQQYNAVFYITDFFVKDHRFCRLIDITNWVNIPPPEFIMSTSPSNSIVLRPGEQKDIELRIKGNTNLPSEAYMTDFNNNNSNNSIDDNNKGVLLTFIPNKVSVLPSGVGTSTLHMTASSNAKPISYTIPIVANISFPNTITNRGGETFSNSKNEILTQRSNITLTIMPPYTLAERFSSFVSTWITPITGVWTFLAGVGAVVAPVIISTYHKKKGKKLNDSKKGFD